MPRVSTEYDIRSLIDYIEPCAPLELQRRADELLDALEQHASHIAMGPAVAISWERGLCKIEFAYTVAADSIEAATAMSRDVDAIIEAQTPNEAAHVQTTAAPEQAVCA